MVEIDGEKLMVSSSNFDDGSMIVSVGTTDFDNYGDSDFMEMMINKDGEIDYFTLPTGKDDYQRMYKIKPSHYGRMKTQNETNESAGGDFIRIDGDGKYAESFGAEDIDDYIQRIFTFIDEKVGTEYFGSIEDEEEVIRFKQAFMDKFNEIEEPPIIDWNEIFSAESFGAEMKLPKLTKNQMDFLKYKTSWFMAYSAYARGKLDRNWSPEDWKDGKAEQCFTITSDGWGNGNIARRTLKSLFDKKVIYATNTDYSSYDGRIRKSPAQQVNENPDLIIKQSSPSFQRRYGTPIPYDRKYHINKICLGLTPIGVEIIKREFAHQVKDVVGWRIELTLEDGQTAYLSDMPDDISQSIDNHIEDVRWDSMEEQFGAESFKAELLGYPHPMSDRQKHRIRKLGGRIDKAMSRSQASQYIKSLMRIEPLHAETHALDCSACQGWGWNEDLNMVCDADGCIGGWIVPKKPSLLERGLELGAGVGMGVAGVAILFGVLGGTVGFAAEELKKRRD